MRLFLHGISSEPYDREYRLSFLKFLNGDRVEFSRELCGHIGVNAAEQERLMK